MSEWLDATALTPAQIDQVDVWMFHMNTTPPGIKRFYPILSAQEKERSERFVHFMDRKRFIASHGFMRSVLARYLDIAPETICYDRKANDKPILKPDVHDSNLQFNLTHSGHFAMLAVSPKLELGMDVEYMDRKNRWQDLIRRFFTPPEQQAIFALPEDQQQRAFFQVWTRKEAQMKVTGKGLSLAPTQFTVTVPPAAPTLLAMKDTDEQTLQRWHMYDVVLPASAQAYCACLSVEGKASSIRQFIFQ